MLETTKNENEDPTDQTLSGSNFVKNCLVFQGLESLISGLLYGCFQKIGGKPPKWMVKIMENPIF